MKPGIYRFGVIGVAAAALLATGCETAPAVAPKAATEMPAAIEAKAPAPAATPTPVEQITSWTGTGPTDTTRFEASGPAWKVRYKARAAAGAADGFQIFVQRADNGRMLALAVDEHGTVDGTAIVPSPPGTYFLGVRSSGTWEVSVLDLHPAPAPATAPASATAKAP